MDSSEHVVVDPATGGRKGRKRARFDLIPPGPLWETAEHYGVGADKYEDRNWERGYAWSLSFGALQRHAWAFWNGESRDPETGTHHLAAVAFHAFALMFFERRHPGLDDRPSSSASAADIEAELEAPPEPGPAPYFVSIGDLVGHRARITGRFTGSPWWVGRTGMVEQPLSADELGHHRLRLRCDDPPTTVAVEPWEIEPA